VRSLRYRNDQQKPATTARDDFSHDDVTRLHTVDADVPAAPEGYGLHPWKTSTSCLPEIGAEGWVVVVRREAGATVAGVKARLLTARIAFPRSAENP
jgi:hypothetical protein